MFWKPAPGLPGAGATLLASGRMRIDAVLFDLDETLLDLTSSRPARYRRALETLVELTGEGDVEAGMLRLEEMEARGIDPVVRLKTVMEGMGHGDSEHGIAAYETIFNTDLMQLHEGAEAVLEQLRGKYKLGLVTNGPGRHQLPKIENFLLGRYFGEAFAIGDDFGYPKPDARIFRHVAGLLGVEPGHTVFVGDRLDSDIGGAKSAGMVAVWVKSSYQPEYDGPSPDYEIDRIVELPVVLGKIETAIYGAVGG